MKRRYYITYYARFTNGETGCYGEIFELDFKPKLTTNINISYLESLVMIRNTNSNNICMEVVILGITKMKRRDKNESRYI